MAKRRAFTKAERQAVYEKCNGHCAYCGRKIAFKDMQIDHLVALKRWNREDGTNDMDNLMPSCRSCNHYKDTCLLEDFRKNIENIPSVLERDKPTFRIAERYGLITLTHKPVKFYFEKLKEQDTDEAHI